MSIQRSPQLLAVQRLALACYAGAIAVCGAFSGIHCHVETEYASNNNNNNSSDGIDLLRALTALCATAAGAGVLAMLAVAWVGIIPCQLLTEASTRQRRCHLLLHMLLCVVGGAAMICALQFFFNFDSASCDSDNTTNNISITSSSGGSSGGSGDNGSSGSNSSFDVDASKGCDRGRFLASESGCETWMTPLAVLVLVYVALMLCVALYLLVAYLMGPPTLNHSPERFLKRKAAKAKARAKARAKAMAKTKTAKKPHADLEAGQQPHSLQHGGTVAVNGNANFSNRGEGEEEEEDYAARPSDRLISTANASSDLFVMDKFNLASLHAPGRSLLRQATDRGAALYICCAPGRGDHGSLQQDLHDIVAAIASATGQNRAMRGLATSTPVTTIDSDAVLDRDGQSGVGGKKSGDKIARSAAVAQGRPLPTTPKSPLSSSSSSSPPAHSSNLMSPSTAHASNSPPDNHHRRHHHPTSTASSSSSSSHSSSSASPSSTPVVVTLLQPLEFELMGIPDFLTQVRQAGLESKHFPVRDKWFPSNMAAFGAAALDIVALLVQGRSVVVHCYGGKGRAGTMCGAVIMLLTVNLTSGEVCSTNTAIRCVRKTRSGTLKNWLQQLYLHSFREVQITKLWTRAQQLFQTQAVVTDI